MDYFCHYEIVFCRIRLEQQTLKYHKSIIKVTHLLALKKFTGLHAVPFEGGTGLFFTL